MTDTADKTDTTDGPSHLVFAANLNDYLRRHRCKSTFGIFIVVTGDIRIEGMTVKAERERARERERERV